MRHALALVVATAFACGCAQAHPGIRLIGESSPAFSALIDLKPVYASAAAVRVDTAAMDRSALMAALAHDAEAPPDLAVVPHHLLGRLVADDAIHPIKSFVDDLKLFDPRVVDPQIDLLPSWRELSQYRHQIYGYPLTIVTTRPGLFFSWLTFAYAFGARIMDSPSGDAYGPIVVNSPEAVAATEQFVAFQRHPGRIGDTPPTPANGGRAVPLDGDTFVIPSRARHPREAFRVMQQILSNDVQMRMADSRLLSPRKSASKDPHATNGGVPIPTIPEAQAIIDTMTPTLAQIVSGALTAQQGLDAVAVQLEALLPAGANGR
jgi:ABC-type glycerol-3-phosphate transport system substrate-binding protein